MVSSYEIEEDFDESNIETGISSIELTKDVPLDRHQQRAEVIAETFVGRISELKAVRSFARTADESTIFQEHMCIVHSKASMGKSAFIAKACEMHACEQQSAWTHVLPFFVGFGPKTSGWSDIVLHICDELHLRFGSTKDARNLDMVVTNDHTDESKLSSYALKAKLDVHLASASKAVGLNSTILIAIDGLNGLMSSDTSFRTAAPTGMNMLEWLPLPFPPNIRLIVSITEGSLFRLLQDRLKEANLRVFKVGLRPLAIRDKVELARSILQRYGKRLDESPLNNQLLILTSKADAGVPMYLEVACQELRLGASFENLNHKLRMLAGNVAALFVQILERMETELGRELVSATMQLLLCSRDGLRDSDILSLFLDSHANRKKKKTQSTESLKSSSSLQCFGADTDIYLFANLSPLHVHSLIHNISPFLTKPIRSRGNSDVASMGQRTFLHPQLRNICLKRYLPDGVSSKSARPFHQALAHHYENLLRAHRRAPKQSQLTEEAASENTCPTNWKVSTDSNSATDTGRPWQSCSSIVPTTKKVNENKMGFVASSSPESTRIGSLFSQDDACALVNLPYHLLMGFSMKEFKNCVGNLYFVEAAARTEQLQEAAAIYNGLFFLDTGVSLSALSALSNDPLFIQLHGFVLKHRQLLSVYPTLSTQTAFNDQAFPLLCREATHLLKRSVKTDGKAFTSRDHMTSQSRLRSNIRYGSQPNKKALHQSKNSVDDKESANSILSVSSLELLLEALSPVSVQPKVPIESTDFQHPITAIAVSPGGCFIAVGIATGIISVIELQTERRVAVLQAHAGAITHLVFYGEEMLLSAGNDDVACCWNIATQEKIVTYRGHSSRVAAVAPIHDHHLVATCSWDHTVFIYDQKSDRPRTILRDDMGPAHALAVSPGGDFLAIGHWSGGIAIWDVLAATTSTATKASKRSSKKFALELSLPSSIAKVVHTGSSVRAMAYSADGYNLFVISQSGCVTIYATQGGVKVTTCQAVDGPGVTPLSLSLSEQSLSIACTDGLVRVFDSRLGKINLYNSLFSGPTVSSGCDATCSCILHETALVVGYRDGTVAAFTLTGKTICSAKLHTHAIKTVSADLREDCVITTGEDQTAVLITGIHGLAMRGSSSGSYKSLRTQSFKHEVNILAACIITRTEFAVGDDQQHVHFWQHILGKYKLVSSISVHDSGVSALVRHPIRSALFSGGWDGKISIIHSSTRKIHEEFPNAHTDRITQLRMDPKGTRLVSTSNDGLVKVFQYQHQGFRQSKTTESTDGRTSSSSSSKPYSLELMATLARHDGIVVDATVLKNKHILTCGTDATYCWWDESGNLLASRKQPMRECYGISAVYTKANKSLGKGTTSSLRLFMCGSEGTVLCWQPEMLWHITDLCCHTRDVTSVAQLPEGSLLTASLDGTLSCWKEPENDGFMRITETSHLPFVKIRDAFADSEAITLHDALVVAAKHINKVSPQFGHTIAPVTGITSLSLSSSVASEHVRTFAIVGVSGLGISLLPVYSRMGADKEQLVDPSITSPVSLTVLSNSSVLGRGKSQQMISLKDTRAVLLLGGEANVAKTSDYALLHAEISTVRRLQFSCNDLAHMSNLSQVVALETATLATPQPITRIVHDPFHKRVIICGWHGMVAVCDELLRDVCKLGTHDRYGHWAIDAAVSPCGRFLAVAFEHGAVDVYCCDTQQFKAYLRCTKCNINEPWATGLAWVPEGLFLTTSSGSMYCWRSNCKESVNLNPTPQEFHGHSTSISALTVHHTDNSADVTAPPSVIITADKAGFIRVWRLENHDLELIGAVRVASAVTSCALSCDGKLVLVGTCSGASYFFERCQVCPSSSV